MKNSIVSTLLLSFLFQFISSFPLLRDFYSDRDQILATEDSQYLGADLILNGYETLANIGLMNMKNAELDKGFSDSFYPPSMSFFKSKAQIENSSVFNFLKEMPKGAALHLHDLSIASIDWVISDITYR